MNPLVRYISLAFALALLAACKVQMEPGAGGAVVSESGSLTCYPGETCTINVSDKTFDETFVAIPADGYEFVRWIRGSGNFCGNRTIPCRLFTTAFGDNAALLGYLADENSVFYLRPEFRFIGAAEEQVTLFDIAEDGTASGVATADGGVIWSEQTETGTNSVYVKLPDASEMYIEFGADGMPRDLHYQGLFIRFRQFTDTGAIIETIDAAGNGVVGEVPYTDALFDIVTRLTDSATSTSVQPARSLATTSTEPLNSATELLAEASASLQDAVTATQLAQQVIASQSLRPLIEDASQTAINTLTAAVEDRLENPAATSEDLQLRVLAGAGVCYLSIAGGGLIKLVSGLPGCETFVKESYAAVNSWAVQVVENQYKNTLDALAEQAPLYGDEFAQAVSNQMVSSRDVLGDYEHDISITRPKDGDFVQTTEVLAVAGVVTDRVTEDPVSRSRTIEVDYVDFAADGERYYRVDRRGLFADKRYGGQPGDPEVSLASDSSGPVRTEGELVFNVSNLAVGRHTLSIWATTLGISNSKKINVIATPYKPPFNLQVTPDTREFEIEEPVSLTAKLVDADGLEITEATYAWTFGSSEIGLSNTADYQNIFTDSGTVVLDVTAIFYDVPFQESVRLDIDAPSLTGTWNATYTEDGTDCGDGVSGATVTISVTQSGDSVSILDVTGTLSGNLITFSQTVPDGNGTFTEQGTITVSSDFNSMSGQSSWRYQEEGYSCSGLNTFSAVRVQ